MPWTVGDVESHIKGLSDKQKAQWVAVANSALEKCEREGGKDCDASAIRQANGVVRESFQTAYAELIQESAKHMQDVSEIVKKGQQALEDGDYTILEQLEAKTAELRETEACKLEDGKKYPADAFAYTPSKDPTTWQLRLREGDKVAKARLDKAASFLSPGGCAGKRIEIPLEEVATVKRVIRTAYKSLGVPDAEISKWVKEAEMRNIVSEYTPLTEAVISSKGTANVVVLSPGFNASKERYYDKETLKRDFGVFEGAKMFSDHPTDAEDKARPERSIKDWVATLKNVRMNDKGQVIGEAVVVEPWMQEKLATLRDKGLLNEMGISINAVGQATKQTIEGVKTNFIEKLVRARSVDFVTSPGAGGMVQMYESAAENDIDVISLESLKERRSDLVEIIVNEAKAEFKSEVKKYMELQETVDKLTKDNETLLKENGELKASIETEKQAKAKAEAQAAIKEAVAKAELPEPAKARLLEKFADSIDSKGLDEAIKAEKDYIAKLTEASKVKGMGKTEPDTKKAHEALRESFKRMHPDWTDKQLDNATNGR